MEKVFNIWWVVPAVQNCTILVEYESSISQAQIAEYCQNSKAGYQGYFIAQLIWY